MNVLITFSLIGTDAGPFDLYSDVDGYSNAFELGVTRAELLVGFPTDKVPNGTTSILARSTGVCTNFVIMPVPVGPTTTTTSTTAGSTTTTTSTTAVPTTTTTTTPGSTTTTTSSSSTTTTSTSSTTTTTTTVVPTTTTTTLTSSTTTTTTTVAPTTTTTSTSSTTTTTTTICTRPAGMPQTLGLRFFVTPAESPCGAVNYDIYGAPNLATVCEYWQAFKNCACSFTVSYGLTTFQFASLTVGERIYFGYTTDCGGVAPGRFFYMDNNNTGSAVIDNFCLLTTVTIITVGANSLITAIDTCTYTPPSTTTTSTTVAPTTTTTTSTLTTTTTTTAVPTTTTTTTITNCAGAGLYYRYSVDEWGCDCLNLLDTVIVQNQYPLNQGNWYYNPVTGRKFIVQVFTGCVGTYTTSIETNSSHMNCSGILCASAVLAINDNDATLLTINVAEGTYTNLTADAVPAPEIINCVTYISAAPVNYFVSFGDSAIYYSLYTLNPWTFGIVNVVSYPGGYTSGRACTLDPYDPSFTIYAINYLSGPDSDRLIKILDWTNFTAAAWNDGYTFTSGVKITSNMLYTTNPGDSTIDGRLIMVGYDPNTGERTLYQMFASDITLAPEVELPLGSGVITSNIVYIYYEESIDEFILIDDNGALYRMNYTIPYNLIWVGTLTTNWFYYRANAPLGSTPVKFYN